MYNNQNLPLLLLLLLLLRLLLTFQVKYEPRRTDPDPELTGLGQHPDQEEPMSPDMMWSQHFKDRGFPHHVPRLLEDLKRNITREVSLP